MPGVFGIADRRGVAASSLASMAEAMCTQPHYVRDELFVGDVAAASRVHLGRTRMTSTPAHDPSGVHAWVHGEVYNLAAAVEALGWSEVAVANRDVAAWLVRAYRQGELDALLARLDGFFCAAIFDAERRRISLISDRTGLRMLYYYHRGGSFVWASEVKGILVAPGVDKAVDPVSLPCFMDLGYLMGEHTWFEHVRLMPPTAVVEYDIDADTVRKRHYWSWAAIQPSKLSFDDAVDAMGEAFVAAVARRFDPQERTGISLSGGLDSRAILAAVTRLDPEYQGFAYTFGRPDCDDIVLARQVIARTRWRHQVFPLDGKNWLAPRLAQVWSTDGMLDLMHMHGGEFMQQCAAEMDVNLNGYMGDAIIGGGWLPRLVEGQRGTLENTRSFFGKYGHLAGMESTYFDFPNAEPVLFMSRTRRFTNVGTVNHLTAVEQRKPFFGNGVIELALALPFAYRAHNRLHAAMVHRFFPTFFRDIPWQKTGQVAGILLPHGRAYAAWDKAKRLALGLSGRAPRKYFTDYGTWVREPAVSAFLSKLLDRNGAVYADYTDEDFVARYLRPHLSRGLYDHSGKILRAATIELYLRRALRGEATAFEIGA